MGLAVRYGPGQLPVLDANGNLTTVPGSGARNNTFTRNRGTGNARFDGTDENPGCGSDRWIQNQFTQVNQPCVLGSGSPPAGG